MTEEQKDRVLADCLEAYHRERALGEVPDLGRYRDRLGDLYEEFVELVAAETAIDEALDSCSEDDLPQTFGEYILLSELGRGGAGVVYEALHRKLGRKVALKVLRTGMDTEENARERFRREAQALAQVRHDNIVEIYEYGELGGRLYYAMSLVDGPSLGALVKRKELRSPQELCAGLAGVADALQALHEAGIIHRDVKSSNIMIAPNGRYMLADFGLARTEMAETMTRTGDALGTPYYMSPEQVLGDRDAVEARTDVYGLGVTLYELLCGQRPFHPDNLAALMRMILSQRAQPPNTIDSSLPPGCSSIAMKCLEKEPRYRYQSAAELAGELRAFAEGRRVSTRPVNAVQRGSRYVRKHPKRSLLATAAAAVVAVGAFSAFKPEPPPRLSVVVARREATVQVNGSDPRPAPLRNHPVEKNVLNRVVVRPVSDRWLPYETEIAIDKDRQLDIPAFEPADGRDPVAAEEVAGDLGAGPLFEEPKPRQHRGSRSIRNPTIQVGFPRGRVRREDLREWRVFQGLDFEGKYAGNPGRIEFRIDGQTIASTVFPPSDFVLNMGAIPESVLEALEPGTTVTWGFYPPEGRYRQKDLRTTTFTLVDDALEEKVRSRFEAFDAQMAEWTNLRTKSILRATLRAGFLLNEGLPQGAYDVVSAVIRTPGSKARLSEDATQGLVELERIALRRLYPMKREREDSEPWADYVDDHQSAWPTEAWDEFYAGRAAADRK